MSVCPGFTKTVALETAQAGNVTCNAICPGYVLTDLIRNQLEDTAKARGIPKATFSLPSYLLFPCVSRCMDWRHIMQDTIQAVSSNVGRFEAGQTYYLVQMNSVRCSFVGRDKSSGYFPVLKN